MSRPSSSGFETSPDSRGLGRTGRHASAADTMRADRELGGWASFAVVLSFWSFFGQPLLWSSGEVVHLLAIHALRELAFGAGLVRVVLNPAEETALRLALCGH